MPNFKAEEKLPGRPVTKLEDAPAADFNSLRELGAVENYPRRWEYQHPKHTLDEVISAGYWRGDVRDSLRLGDEISYTLGGGSKDPTEWQRGILVVCEIPSQKSDPVVVGILHRYGKITPVRGVEAKKAKAAA